MGRERLLHSIREAGQIEIGRGGLRAWVGGGGGVVGEERTRLCECWLGSRGMSCWAGASLSVLS